MRESVQRSVENIFPSFQLSLFLPLSLPQPSVSFSRLRWCATHPSAWKPLELRKIDKSSAAEQFVYSTARLRANELQRITYSHGLSSPRFPPSPPTSSTTDVVLLVLLLLDPFYPDDRPSFCACDRGHWASTHVRLHLCIPFHRAVPFCQSSFQLLTGSSVGRPGYSPCSAF